VPHFVRCALGGNLAIGQHNHLVGNMKGLILIVRHDVAGVAECVVELANQTRSRAQ
jgi:hypothetical protein